MKTQTDKTRVKFLVNPMDPNEVFAYFPDINYNTAMYGFEQKMSYAHVGQHSACHFSYADESRAATQEEYADLKKELEDYGYVLEVVSDHVSLPVLKAAKVDAMCRNPKSGLMIKVKNTEIYNPDGSIKYVFKYPYAQPRVKQKSVVIKNVKYKIEWEGVD